MSIADDSARLEADPPSHEPYNEGVRGRALPDWLSKRLARFDGRRMADLLATRRAPDPHGIQLFSNDYLTLANHPGIVGAQRAALEHSSDSLWMSAVFFGADSGQCKLERGFAAYLGAEDCVLSQSGYSANVGLLQSIAGPETTVFIDESAHASLWHGVLASRAKFRRFAHNEPTALEALLRRSGPGIVIVDSVYSHDGSVCPLEDIVALAARHDCVVIVDESHALGTHGPRGAGLVAELGLVADVQFRTASLAKAFVSRAGLIAASEPACWLVKHAAGPAIFSSACMAHDLAGLEAALELIVHADNRRRRLFDHAATLRLRLQQLGYAVASRSQIIALESGLESETIRLRQFLESRGVYGSSFCAPATRPNRSLIRLSVHAGLNESGLERVVDACRGAREHVGFHAWRSTRRYRTASSIESST